MQNCKLQCAIIIQLCCIIACWRHVQLILGEGCDCCPNLQSSLFPLCFSTQFVICKRKLESKKEALLILSKELDTCQQERDQYKLMANQLRERHQGLKKKYRELIVGQQ